MKGSVRVFCRFRPLAKREEDLGDIPVLHKADAFSVDLQRLAPHNDTRRFDFDAVFGGDSPQEEVFRDCSRLSWRHVDGFPRGDFWFWIGFSRGRLGAVRGRWLQCQEPKQTQLWDESSRVD
ncbi:Kinesin-like protein KIN-14I (Kinesin-like calmodulin-binding protein) (OsKCBP) [Durusdinium trenchii]|uniref:Kinesin-like protein KIN-14I (Kinesin-like calmodulin-binding protein) (OsKCBP) n=1 Tax=Durusdinium trenchii TaxID=1381693 RepID=A0ABP0JAE3_9DINO